MDEALPVERTRRIVPEETERMGARVKAGGEGKDERDARLERDGEGRTRRRGSGAGGSASY